MAFRWRADDGPFIAVFRSSILSSTKKKNAIKSGPPLTKLSGSAHGMVDFCTYVKDNIVNYLKLSNLYDAPYEIRLQLAL